MFILVENENLVFRKLFVGSFVSNNILFKQLFLLSVLSKSLPLTIVVSKKNNFLVHSD